MKFNSIWCAIILCIVPCTATAQWIRALGPSGGTITTIFVDGTDIWAGTDADGPYLSTDGGLTWVARHEGLTSTGEDAVYNGYDILCFARLNSSLFVGTRGYGVYRSENDGSSWMKSDSGITNPVVSSFIVSGGNILAGTGRKGLGSASGIFLSTNGGTLWAQIPQVIPKNGFVAGFASLGTIPNQIGSPIYTIVNDTVFSSADDGVTWKAAN